MHYLLTILRLCGGHQKDTRAIDDHLAGITEIHRDLATNVGLHLTQPPIRLLWVRHQHAWFEKGVEVRIWIAHGALMQ